MAKSKHIPAPRVVAVVARDDGNAIRLPGDPRRGAPFKLVLLDVSLLSVASLAVKGVRPIEVDDLEPDERERFIQAMTYAVEDLRTSSQD